MERLLGFDAQLLFDSFVTGINIFILFFALSYFLFNPVRDMLETRKQRIAGELEDAAKDKEAARMLKEEYQVKLGQVEQEAMVLLEDARKKAKNRDVEMMMEAKEEASRILERGGREVELERKKAMDEVKEQMVSIAAVMAAKALAVNLDAAAQDALIEKTLKEIGESSWQS